MNHLITKEVNFQGANLLAVQDQESGKIHVGVSYICKGIGLTEGQKDRQVKNVQDDAVLKKGASNLTVPTKGGKQEVLAIELDYLPLWLAKISITPKMQTEQPEVANNLIEYQLKAKDVLAKAFIKKQKQPQPKAKIRKKAYNMVLKQEMDVAKTFSNTTGIELGIACAVAINRTEEKTGEDLSSYKTLLPSANHETGHLNPTAIGEQLGGIKAQDINKQLESLGLQHKNSKKKWRLTDEGKRYGEEYPFERNGHTDYQIRWNDSIVDVLREGGEKLI